MPVHDPRICTLGEGPLWHPLREQLFWFDILNRKLMTQGREWAFADRVSAAAWIDRDRLLIASERALFRFDLETGHSTDLTPLEPDTANRSNDGRADPQGGFWIGTMGLNAEPGAGAIWRFHKGELRRLYDRISIPNSISFPPDGRSACFADSADGRVMRVALDAEGWPQGTPEPFIDLTGQPQVPDGAVFDAAGNLWLAEWGAARVACYDPQGGFLRAVPVPALQSSCPAFGGPDLSTLFVTSAAVGLPAAEKSARPLTGQTFAFPGTARGLPEHSFTGTP